MKSYISKLKLQGSSEHITSHHHFLTINKAVSETCSKFTCVSAGLPLLQINASWQQGGGAIR